MGTLPYRLSVNHPFDGCYDYGRKAIFFITKINIAFRDILATLIYMKNILNDKDFFEQNLIHMNRVTGKVIAYGNLAPVLLAGGIFLKLYEMPLQWLIIFSCFLIPFTIVQNILTRKCKNQKAIAYFTLFGLEVLVSFLGSNARVNTYISCALVPFISCLYFNPKLTMSVNIFSYAGLLVSLWFKSQAAWNLQMPAVSPMYYWIAFGTGFTVEYIFVFIISNFITLRSHDTLKDIYASNRHIKTIQNKIISSFANLVEGRDSFTGEHIKRTAIYVELISRELVKQGFYIDILTEDNIQLFINTAPLHDLGKIRIPDQILCKPSGFTQDEYEIMKTHSYEGYKLIEENLSEVESEEFLEVAKIMSLYHHEKWDGTGYPNKVKGNDIPLCARIMAAADVLDALLSKRQYKAAMSLEQALDIFEKSRGSHFEPCIVDAVFACQDKIRKIAFPD